MESHILKIIAVGQVTHDVKFFRIEKPAGYSYIPGQATEVAINKPQWENERRPFTFTGLNEDSWLEFTIKRYTDHKGVTDQIHQLKEGDELILHDVWGAIEYKGPGYFIAGGAGLTPFVAIFRHLHKSKGIDENVLFFSNKTSADIIYENELKTILGDNVHFIITQDKNPKYENAFIDENFLRSRIEDFSRHFYVCGPDKMIKEITESLQRLGASADAVVFEK